MTRLNAHLERFIKSGFRQTCFTNSLYEMLYIDSNKFIAHNNKRGFYTARFERDAKQTIASLRTVSKPELRPLCEQLASAMESALRHEVCVADIKICTSVVGGAQ